MGSTYASQTTPLLTPDAEDPPPLSVAQKTAYGVGHVLNDICAALWFSYTLLFFHVVLGLPAPEAGALLLLGQVVDALATPIVGILSDRWGSRKTWHLAGTALVLVSFPFLFSPCYLCSVAPSQMYWLQPVYYSLLITAFQTGWATVQIAHLSLIPDLSPRKDERAELTAVRYMASVCSSLTLYLVTWVAFRATRQDVSQRIGPDDAYRFRIIVYTSICIGVLCTFWFRVGLKLPPRAAASRKAAQRRQSNEKRNKIGNGISTSETFIPYLRRPMLYQAALLYMASRLFLTLSLVYVPLYLDESLNENAEALASVPFVSFVASFLSSLAIKYVSKCCDNKTNYLVGGLLSLVGCIWVGAGVSRGGEMYGVAIFMGAGSSITMVTSLCITADLIGTNTDQGAFVYSVVTFADKLFNGIAVMIIEELKCADVVSCPHYYQGVLAYVCGGSAVLGIIVLLTLVREPRVRLPAGVVVLTQ